jgi:arabinosaccharide transport system substrate-binding protein
MKKSGFIVLVGLLVFLSACTPNVGAPEANDAKPAGNQADAKTDDKGSKKLTLWVFAEAHKRFYEAVKEEFKKKQPNVEVDINLMDGNALVDKYTIIAKSGGEGSPDLIDIEQGQFPKFIRGDIPFEALDPYLKRDNLSEVMSKGRQALYTVNGKQYGIEHAATASALYYRKDVFDQAGINVAELKTWDQFTEQAKKLVGDKKYIFPPSPATKTNSEQTYFELLIKQEGGDIVTTKGEIGFNSPEGVTALKRMNNWEKDGIMDKNFYDGPAFWDQYKKGNYIAAFGPDWWVNQLADNVPDLSGKWAAVPIPLGGAKSVPTSVWGGTGLMISKFAKNKDLAWEFVKTAQLTPEMSVKRFQIVNLFPALLTSVNEKGLHEQSKYTQYFNGQDLGELYGKLVAVAPNQNQAWWRALFTQAWDKFKFDYAEGKLTPEQFLQKVEEELKQQIKKQEASG